MGILELLSTRGGFATSRELSCPYPTWSVKTLSSGGDLYPTLGERVSRVESSESIASSQWGPGLPKPPTILVHFGSKKRHFAALKMSYLFICNSKSFHFAVGEYGTLASPSPKFGDTSASLMD